MDETLKKVAAINRRTKSDYIRILLEDHFNDLKAKHAQQKNKSA